MSSQVPQTTCNHCYTTLGCGVLANNCVNFPGIGRGNWTPDNVHVCALGDLIKLQSAKVTY